LFDFVTLGGIFVFQ